MRLMLIVTSLSTFAACAVSPQPDGTSVREAYVRQGYTPSLVEGQLLYCRSEAVTGTQFPARVCLSEQQIKDAEQKTRDTAKSRAMHPNLQCHSQDCSG